MSNKKIKKGLKTAKKHLEVQKKDQFFQSKRMRALITTFFTVMGVYAAFLTPILQRGSVIVDDFFVSQATVGGLYVNSVAVIATAYSKFSSSMLIHGRTFFISIFSIFIAINIFCQAKCMQNMKDYLLWETLREIGFAYLLQIIFFSSIYILILEPGIENKKERIRK